MIEIMLAIMLDKYRWLAQALSFEKVDIGSKTEKPY